jgi:hypothetical protein
VAAEQVVQDAITVNLLVMTAVLACYLTSVAHQLGMQVVVVDSVEILQDMLHLKVLEVQHLPAAVAVVQEVAAAVEMVAIVAATEALTQAVVVAEVVQVLGVMAVPVSLFYAIIQKLAAL